MPTVYATVSDSRIAYTTVEHELYGCETGCCGLVAYAYDSINNVLYQSKFEFYHCETLEEATDFAKTFFPDAEFNEKESDWKGCY